MDYDLTHSQFQDLARIRATPDRGLYPRFYMINRAKHLLAEINSGELAYVKLVLQGYESVDRRTYEYFIIEVNEWLRRKELAKAKRKLARAKAKLKPKKLNVKSTTDKIAKLLGN